MHLNQDQNYFGKNQFLIDSVPKSMAFKKYEVLTLGKKNFLYFKYRDSSLTTKLKRQMKRKLVCGTHLAQISARCSETHCVGKSVTFGFFGMYTRSPFSRVLYENYATPPQAHDMSRMRDSARSKPGLSHILNYFFVTKITKRHREIDRLSHADFILQVIHQEF